MYQIPKQIVRIAGAIVMAVAAVLALPFTLHSISFLQASPLEPPIGNNSGVHHNNIFPVTGTLLGLVTDLDQLNALECAVGKQHSVIKIYQDLSHSGFWDHFADFIDNRGAKEFLSLDPRTKEGGEERDLNSCEVLSGDYDSTIITFATEIKAWRKPLLFSTMGEMNGTWPGWAGANNFGPTCTTYTQVTDMYGHYGCTDTTKIECADGPERYRAAYRHMHDTFTVTGGVTNATWVWVVNHESLPPPPTTLTNWNVITNYYPGDDYVDVISVDGYNWGHDGPGGWKTFTEIFSETLTTLHNTYPGKPVIIGEFASAEGAYPAEKADWIRDAYGRIKSDWPGIRAAVWYNSDGTTFSITSSPESIQAYREAIADPYFMGDHVQCNYLPLIFKSYKPTTLFCTNSGKGGTETITVESLRPIRGVHIDLLKRALPSYGFSLWEVEIYGSGTSNLAIGATATASSSQDGPGCYECFPEKAIDGRMDTRWGSDFYEPQWLEITFPSLQVVNRIVLKWEAAYAQEYCVIVNE